MPLHPVRAELRGRAAARLARLGIGPDNPAYDRVMTKALRRMTTSGETLGSVASEEAGLDVTVAPDGTVYWTEQNDSGYFGTVYVGAVGDRTQVNISLIAPEMMS